MGPDQLMLRFEALGDNCEFGLVQRQGGAEPLGLLRFAGFFIPIEHRLARLRLALESGFDGLGRPETVRVEAAGAAGRREYLVWEDGFNLMYHTFQPEHSVDPEALRGLEARRLGFLRRKFFSDLAGGEKILVWKSNLPQAAADVEQLVEQLRGFGPNTLLWAEQENKAHPAGTVETVGEGLLKGYVERFAPYNNATDISYESWFAMCAEAHRLWQTPGRPRPSDSPETKTMDDLKVTPETALLGGKEARPAGYPARPALPATPNLPVADVTVAGALTAVLATKLQYAFDKALAGAGDVDPRLLSIPGMSGTKFRLFLHHLVGSVEGARYLETGVFQGATFCSAIWRNRVNATAIDNWSEYGGPANAFYKHLGEFWEPTASVTVLNRDFRQVEYGSIGKFNIHLFDGPHQYQDQYDGAHIVHDALDDTAIFIVDDWNWEQVRSGTHRGLADAGVRVEYAIEVRTTLDNSFPSIHSTGSDWHNGVFMGVITKGDRR